MPLTSTTAPRSRPSAIRPVGQAAGGAAGASTLYGQPQAPPLPTPGRTVQTSAPTPQAGATAPTTPQFPQFGPGNDLRFSQVLPQSSPRTTGLLAQADGAMAGLMGAGNFSAGTWSADVTTARAKATAALDKLAAGAPITAEDSAALASYRAMTQQAAGDVMEGPDRIQMSKEALADWDTANAPALQGRLRAVGQKAAALGRVGSGDTTESLGNVQSAYERDRMLAENALIRDATEGTIGDRLNRLGAISNLTAQTQGLEEAMREEARRERGYTTSFDLAKSGLLSQQADSLAGFDLGQRGLELSAGTASANFGLNRASLLGDWAMGADGMDRADRSETRGERAYQYGVGRDAVSDQITAAQLAEQFTNGEFNRGLQMANLGYGGNPSNAYSNAGANAGAGAGASMGAGLDMLGNWAYDKYGRPVQPGQTGGGGRTSVPDFTGTIGQYSPTGYYGGY